MYYVIIGIVCFAVGYILGVYSAKKVKQELREVLSALNDKIDDLQAELNEKIDNLQDKIKT